MSSTLFGATSPVVSTFSDATDLALGTRFTPGVDGTITHGRWFFPNVQPSASLAVIAAVYRVSDQVLLGQASFPLASVSSQWNQVAFASPIAVSAGVQYVATIWTPNQYVALNGYTYPFTSGDLTAGASNGWFRAGFGSLTYPTTVSGGSASYFADVVFEPSGGSGTTTVTSDLDMRWDVRGSVTSDLDMRWSVNGYVSSDLTHRWQVQGDSSQTVRQGSWWQLSAAWKLDAEFRREERSSPPSACPNDGEPLKQGPRGELYCPYDGWKWRA